MPVNTRPSDASAAEPTVWSVIVRCGVSRGTTSMQAFAAAIRSSSGWVRGMVDVLVLRRDELWKICIMRWELGIKDCNWSLYRDGSGRRDSIGTRFARLAVGTLRLHGTTN